MSQVRRSVFDGACPDRVAELEAYIETSEASEELLAHIDSCPRCGEVTKRVFKIQTDGLEKLRRILGEASAAENAGADKARTAGIAGRSLVILAAIAVVAVVLLTAVMVARAYAGLRDQELGRAVRERVDVLFSGALDANCTADPATLCRSGAEASACAASEWYRLLPFPAPTKVYCQFNAWPRPHSGHGAAFLIVDGPSIVSYRYPNCPTGGIGALVTVEGGRPQVRRSPVSGEAADECAAGSRIEVDRWRSAPTRLSSK